MSHSLARRRAALAMLPLAAALAAAPAIPAQAAPIGQPITKSDGSVELPIEHRVQEKSQWCWVATGSVIADYHGKDVSQKEFCNRGRGASLTADCANEPGDLYDEQRAYRSLGLNPGNIAYQALPFYYVKSEVNANRPVLARIGWRSGGGHMLTVYGYDSAKQTIKWSDPWGSNPRQNVTDWSYLASNDRGTWTHSIYNVKGY